MDGRGRHVVVQALIGSVDRKHRVVLGERRRYREDVRLPAWTAQEGIVQTTRRGIEPHLGSPGRRDRGIEVELCVHELVRLAVRRPDRGFAAARWIPGNSNARPEIL